MTEKAELFSSHPTVSKMFSVFRLDPFSALTMLPSRFRPQFNHLFQALIDENDAEANFLLEKIKTLDLSKTIKTKSELDVVGNAFAVALQLSLEDSRKIFPAYFELLELFVQFASFHADLDEFSRHVRKLFQIQDIFCVSYFDQWNRRIVAWENLYKIHVSAIETLFPSPGFQKWAAMRSNTAFLEFFIRDSMIKLVYLAKNHREELFFSLLHECLSLASYYQDLLESLSLLTCFLPTLKDSFFSSDNFKKKNLLEFFTKHFHKSDGSRFQKFIEEILKRLESDGTFPADLSRKLFRNSKSLDVNEIYRQALIEILGDDILTSSEQAILHDLRDFLEIPYDTYQSLFIQVSEELKAGKFPPVSTSFQPERFLRRVFVKILEDGKIEEAETSLLMKVGRALRLDDDFLKTLLNEKLPVDSISETQENSKIQPLQMAISEFEIEKNVVSNLEKSLEKSLIANICSENSFPFGPESFPIALFFDDPKHLSAPLIGICTNQKHASALKLQMKGNIFELRLKKDFANAMKNPIGPFEKDLLRLTNVCLEEDIEIKFTLVNDGIKSFYDCLERSKGRFNLAFFLLPDFAPFAVVPMEGYIDDSGILEKAVSLMDECKFENALEILCILRKKNPNLHQVAFNIGVAYQKLALAGFSFNENRFNAVRFFQEELSLNPHSALAMNNIAEIEKLRGNLEGSIRWLELAINEAPASLRILSNLIKSRVLLCQKSKSSTAQILEKIEPELGRCFQIHPEHRITQELLRTLSKIFDFEFLRKNPFFPVDFRYA